MLPGPDIYYKCPKCEKVIKIESILSGNTFGAKQYSDGRMFAPMMPEYPRITACRKCGNIYWLKDEYEVSGYIPSKKHPLISQEEYDENEYMNKKNMRAKFLMPDQYNDALNNKIYETRQEEIFLRIRFWWCVNDKIRAVLNGNPFNNEEDIRHIVTRKIKEEINNSQYKYDFVKDFLDKIDREVKELSASETSYIKRRKGARNRNYYQETNCIDNMKELISILTEDIVELSKPETQKDNADEIENDTFMIAELHRNLGNFEECKNILKNITNPESNWLKELFEEECDKENKDVFKIIEE